MKKNLPFFLIGLKKILPFFLIGLNALLFGLFSIILYAKQIHFKDNERLTFKSGKFKFNNVTLNIFEFEFAGLLFTVSSLLILGLLILLRYKIIDMLKTINLSKLFSKYILLFLFLFGLEMIISEYFPNFIRHNIVLSQIVWNKVFLILSLGILIPILEEFVFRVHFVDNFFLDQNIYVKTFLVSMVFTLFHMGNNSIGALLFIFSFSLISTYAYIREKNMTIPLFMHIVNNSLFVLFN